MSVSDEEVAPEEVTSGRKRPSPKDLRDAVASAWGLKNVEDKDPRGDDSVASTDDEGGAGPSGDKTVGPRHDNESLKSDEGGARTNTDDFSEFDVDSEKSSEIDPDDNLGAIQSNDADKTVEDDDERKYGIDRDDADNDLDKAEVEEEKRLHKKDLDTLDDALKGDNDGNDILAPKRGDDSADKPENDNDVDDLHDDGEKYLNVKDAEELDNILESDNAHPTLDDNTPIEFDGQNEKADSDALDGDEVHALIKGDDRAEKSDSHAEKGDAKDSEDDKGQPPVDKDNDADDLDLEDEKYLYEKESDVNDDRGDDEDKKLTSNTAIKEDDQNDKADSSAIDGSELDELIESGEETFGDSDADESSEEPRNKEGADQAERANEDELKAGASALVNPDDREGDRDFDDDSSDDGDAEKDDSGLHAEDASTTKEDAEDESDRDEASDDADDDTPQEDSDVEDASDLVAADTDDESRPKDSEADSDDTDDTDGDFDLADDATIESDNKEGDDSEADSDKASLAAAADTSTSEKDDAVLVTDDKAIEDEDSAEEADSADSDGPADSDDPAEASDATDTPDADEATEPDDDTPEAGDASETDKAPASDVRTLPPPTGAPTLAAALPDAISEGEPDLDLEADEVEFTTEDVRDQFLLLSGEARTEAEKLYADMRAAELDESFRARSNRWYAAQAAYLVTLDQGHTPILGIPAHAPRDYTPPRPDDLGLVSIGVDNDRLIVTVAVYDDGDDGRAHIRAREVETGKWVREGTYEYLEDLITGPNADPEFIPALQTLTEDPDHEDLIAALLDGTAYLDYKVVSVDVERQIVMGAFVLGGDVLLKWDGDEALELTLTQQEDAE